ncbi:MAG TPA: RNA 2',3'-cyclic phosphodiesterase [Steroidobacteraceae bacterium]|nr:RNA 2',3'-cyclic phosphodiesterase [Steroidobacteraceae bacterium]
MRPPLRAPARRLFFALWATAEERRALSAAAAAAVGTSGGRAVPEENLHVTLAFLGQVPAARTTELAALAHRVGTNGALAGTPLVLQFERLAYWHAPQILVALSTAGAAAAALAAALQREASAAGFLPDLKPFRAHVTVARKVTHAAASTPLPSVSWKCAEFALVESRTIATGSVYSVLESYLLGKREKLRTQR